MNNPLKRPEDSSYYTQKDRYYGLSNDFKTLIFRSFTFFLNWIPTTHVVFEMLQITTMIKLLMFSTYLYFYLYL